MTDPRNDRACEVCRGRDKSRLFRQEFSTIDGASLLSGYDVVVCKGCGFTFADDLPGQEKFDTYYRELSKVEYQHRGGKESSFDLERFNADVIAMKEFIPPGGRIIEIGCSTGRLLALLREAGFPEVFGLDPSPVCAAAAKRLYGVTVEVGTLSTASRLETIYDFVILSHLLEHVCDLRQALAKVHGLLSPVGIIFVEVPDATRFAGLPDSPFQQFSVEHINFFSPRSLENLMAANGFETVKCWREVRAQGQGTVMPVVIGVFRVAGAAVPPVRFDAESGPCLAAYIDDSRRIESRLQLQIEQLVVSRRPCLVWGVGTHTQRLLATSRLREANLLAFVDSNENYQGRTLAGLPILAPGELRGREDPILISSRLYQSEIERQIREDLGYRNELILLYEVSGDKNAGEKSGEKLARQDGQQPPAGPRSSG